MLIPCIAKDVKGVIVIVGIVNVDNDECVVNGLDFYRCDIV